MEKKSLYVLLATIAIAPVFFIPTQLIPLEVSKVILMLVGVLISIILLVWSKMKGGEVTFPNSRLINVALGSIALSLVFSTIFGGNIYKSLIGIGTETTTVLFILFLILTSILTAVLVKTKENVFSVLCAWGVSFILIVLVQLIYPSANPLESWADLSIFAGIGAVIGLVGTTATVTKGYMRIFFPSLLIVSMIIMLILGNYIPWSIFGVISVGLIFLVIRTDILTHGYAGIIKRILSKKAFFTPLLVLVICGVALMKGGAITQKAYSIFGITQPTINITDISLPWRMSVDVAGDVIKTSPILGAGPNRFINAFLLYRPTDLNATNAWNIDFNSAFGYIPTLFVNQGLFGIFGWLLLFSCLVVIGVRTSLKKEQQTSPSLPFVVSLYLIIAGFMYVPSHSLLFITAVFIGLFIATLVQDGVIKTTTCAFLARPGILSKAIGIISIVCMIVWGGWYVKKAIGVVYFQRGLAELAVNHFESGYNLIKTASVFGDHYDRYKTALSQLALYQLTTVSGQATTTIQQLVTDLQVVNIDILAQDPTNYYNHLAVARSAAAFTLNKVQDMYATTISSYANAAQLNPNTPALYFEVAQFEANRKNFVDAKRYIGKALELKNDYLEAIFLLSQIQVAEGSTKDAITSVKVAIQIQPTNPVLYFQLGFLEYNEKEYEASITALNKAIELSPDYSNARYFLGLSLAQVGKMTEAIAQFETIQRTNQDNKEVASILENLRAGRMPFTGPQDIKKEKSEKRSTLPVVEKSGSTIKKK